MNSLLKRGIIIAEIGSLFQVTIALTLLIVIPFGYGNITPHNNLFYFLIFFALLNFKFTLITMLYLNLVLYNPEKYKKFILASGILSIFQLWIGTIGEIIILLSIKKNKNNSENKEDNRLLDNNI